MRATHLAHRASVPNLGPNVIVFTPDMPQSQIQSELDTIASQQVPDQFGTQRYAIYFEPGTYGSTTNPLAFQVGYYTSVAGLGASPSDVVINGVIDSFNQCSGGYCDALNNFWRSLSNLTINYTASSSPSFVPANGENQGCLDSNEMWAVSQAAPMRRVIVNGALTLQDYCGRGYASGGFLADDSVSGTIINAGQQQFFTRNSSFGGWSNSVWNQVFMGDIGAPAEQFGGGTQYTTLPATPVSQEAPFLYTDAAGALRVFVPAVQHDTAGPDYAAGPAAGRSLALSDFLVADPSTPVAQMNAALASGRDLLLTPGVYSLERPITVRRAGTVVIGLGFATLTAVGGQEAMRTANVPGVKISGLIFDAGPAGSASQLQLGSCDANACGSPSQLKGDPTLLSDVFFRVGGAQAGHTTDSLLVDSDNVILDDVWAWRADHGNGVGWTSNTADTGLLVNGDGVTAYGLAVEHYQKDEVLWNGQNGRVVFFQNEMPYDPPSQGAWSEGPGIDGYPAFRVGSGVTSFTGEGMGSYSFFDLGLPIYATEAFAAPDTPGVSFHDLLTVFLNANGGSGGIRSVINGVGGPSTKDNADVPVDVVDYP